MPADFLTNTRGKFVIDIRGQLAKDAQAPPFRMSMSMPSRGRMPLPPGNPTFCHVDRFLRYQVNRGREELRQGLAH